MKTRFAKFSILVMENLLGDKQVTAFLQSLSAPAPRFGCYSNLQPVLSWILDSKESVECTRYRHRRRFVYGWRSEE